MVTEPTGQFLPFMEELKKNLLTEAKCPSTVGGNNGLPTQGLNATQLEYNCKNTRVEYKEPPSDEDAETDMPQSVHRDEESFLREITKVLIEKQDLRPLPPQSMLGRAREEVHTTGTSSTKVFKQRPIWDQKWRDRKRSNKTPVRMSSQERQERKQHLQERKKEVFRAKNNLFRCIDYEALFATAHEVKVECPSVDNFVDTCKKLLEAVKGCFNKDKKAIEILHKIDATDLIKTLVGVCCGIATAVFALSFYSAPSFVGFMAMSLCALGTTWCFHKEIFDFAQDNMWYALGCETKLSEVRPFTDIEMKDLLQRRDEYVARNEVVLPDATAAPAPTGDPGASSTSLSSGSTYKDAESLFESWHTGDAEYEGGPFDFPGLRISMLATDIVTGIGAAIADVFGMSQKKSLAKGIAEAPRTIDGIRYVIECAVKFFATLIDKIFGSSFADIFIECKDLDEWSHDVLCVVDERGKGKLELTGDSADRIHNLCKRGRDILVNNKDMSRGNMALHRMCTTEMAKLQIIYNNEGMTSASRPVPLCICLKGASGVGKSYITKAVLMSLGAMVMPEERARKFISNSDAEIWNYCPEEKYANGYKGQWACVMDDMGQLIAAPGQKTDGLAIIRFVNASPCKLDMAELHNKGNTNFSSRVVFCSTNKFDFWNMNIEQPEAFLRRVGIWVEYYPKPEYCTDETRNLSKGQRRLDVSKIKDGCSEEVGIFGVQKLVDAKQQIWVPDKEMGFREFVNFCAKRYKESMAQYGDYCSDLKRIALEALERKNGFEYEGILNWAFKKKEVQPFKSIGDAIKKKREEVTAWTAKVLTDYANGKLREKMKWIGLLLLFLCGIALAFAGLFSFLGGVFSWGRPRRRHKGPVFTDLDGFVDEICKKEHHPCLKDVETFGPPTQAGKNVVKKKITKFMNKSGSSTFTCLGHTLELAHVPSVFSYHAELFSGENPPALFGNMFSSSVLRRNVYHMFTAGMNVEKDESQGKVTMLRGQVGMMNAHYVTQIQNALDAGKVKPENKLILVKHGGVGKVQVPYGHFVDPAKTYVDIERDVAFIAFGDYMPNARDITGLFVDRNVYEKNRDFDVSLIAPRSPVSLAIHEICSRRLDRPTTVGGNEHRHLMVYAAQTQAGDCGGLIFLNEGDPKKRIVGMHMGGHTGDGVKYGFGTIITGDYVQSALAKLPSQIVREYPAECNEELNQHEACLNVIGVSDVLAIQPEKSAYVKSPMFETFGPATKALAKLSKFENARGEKVHPLAEAHKRQVTDNVTINEDDVEAVKNDVVRELKKCVRNTKRVLSFREAVEGASDLKGLKALPRQTSSGLLGLKHPKLFNPGKKAAFGNDGDYCFDTPGAKLAESEVMRLWDVCASGTDPGFVSIDTLKDEKLPVAKVEIGKTRIIRANDLAPTILTRMLFGAVASDLVENRIFNSIAIGMNPYGHEWELVAKRMTSLGPRVIAGDFSGYDNSQSCQLLKAVVGVLKALCDFDDEETNVVCDAVAVSLSQPRYQTGKLIYEQDHGLPSGNPLTSVMNSIFGMIAFRLMWMRCTQGVYCTRALSLKGFQEHVRLLMYGDDNLLNVSEHAIDAFNQKTMIAVAPEFGLKYTSDVKDDPNPPEYRTIENVSFLKRTFRREALVLRRVAPLDLDTVLEMTYYTKRGGSEVSITVDNIGNTLRELSLHGEDVYNKYVPTLVKAAKERMNVDIIPQKWRLEIADASNFHPTYMDSHV